VFVLIYPKHVHIHPIQLAFVCNYLNVETLPACKKNIKKTCLERVEFKLHVTLIRFLAILFRTHSSTTTNLSPSEAMHRPLVLSRLCSIMIGCRTPDWNQLPSHLLGNRHKPVERSNRNHRHEKYGLRQSEGEVAFVPQHHTVKECKECGGLT
jgi:hypothetical protein